MSTSTAVVFLFDTSLGREAFVKATQGQDSVVGSIISGLVERGKKRVKATSLGKGKEKSIGDGSDGLDVSSLSPSILPSSQS